MANINARLRDQFNMRHCANKYGIQSTNEKDCNLRASFRFPAIRFDAPTLLSFSGFTHAHAKCPPVVVNTLRKRRDSHTMYNRDWGMQIAHFCLTWDFQGAKQNVFHSLSFKSDQHVFSPNYINTLSRKKVGRINKMMNKGEMLWFLTKFSRLIL